MRDDENTVVNEDYHGQGYVTIVVVGHFGGTRSPTASLDGRGGQGTGVHVGHVQAVEDVVQTVNGESPQRGKGAEGASRAEGRSSTHHRAPAEGRAATRHGHLTEGASGAVGGHTASTERGHARGSS